MPEPLLYGQSLCVAALVSLLVSLTAAAGRRPVSQRRQVLAATLALTAGLVGGLWVLRWPVVWPPHNALDRLVTLLLPAAVLVELAAMSPRRLPVRGLRGALALAAPLILLYRSVYLPAELSGTGGARDWRSTAGLLAGGAGLLLVLRLALVRPALTRRAPGTVVACLAGAILATGLAILLGGYLKGGSLAFPLAGTLLATALLTRWRFAGSSAVLISVGTVQLAGVVAIGHFFGRLQTVPAIVLLLAPVGCWVTELPRFRKLSAIRAGLLRCAIVAAVCLAVLAVAKRDFDRRMRPLLGRFSTSRPACHFVAAGSFQMWTAPS